MLLHNRTIRLGLRCLIAVTALSLFGAFSDLSSHHVIAAEGPSSSEPSAQPRLEDILQQRKSIYDHIEAKTHVPWQRLAAIDQYERTMAKIPKKSAEAALHQQNNVNRLTAIQIQESIWIGWLNPDYTDQNPKSILLFSGLGKDGSGDGIADPNNDLDLLYSVASFVGSYGSSADDFSIGLWNYYHNPSAVKRINQFAKIYATFGYVPLDQHAFPVPLQSSYAYRSTWGTGRSWGGYRIHEGTDIFASYGVPVRSTCFGIIETKGWNPFGGWRIGIRDLNNYYHYYAHLSGFEKSLQIGDLVKPAQTIGWVGSSGYGKPGTQGKFPPHLHYGIYRDRGLVEWSFDPYPSLKRWENEERRAIAAKNKAKKAADQ
ncbi:M23 family metallopeptidase [Paenibacillus selenitireducens]|uniref:M23 family metallopeptidase n=1 Tax=Paenibacillus selenitireducens TaxID=1324314 RepID=UPI0022B86357|nr:M23 family metallopeptidase [Paenibacillus selenitireducens]